MAQNRPETAIARFNARIDKAIKVTRARLKGNDATVTAALSTLESLQAQKGWLPQPGSSGNGTSSETGKREAHLPGR